jgi:HAD superfamily hydrolase (TIGR01549 family)
MAQFEVISFDAEGTLVTSDFSETIWHEAIPALYAQKKGLDLTEARKHIAEEYSKVGDRRLEWYDIDYWFRHLDLGPSEPVIQSCLNRVAHYPEVVEVLSSLAGEYDLIVASGTPLKLLHCLLRDIEHYFVRIFSSISHYGQVKSADFYLKVCAEMAVEPSRVVHVGDNWEFDFLSAKQAGLNAFHIDRSGGNHHESLSNLAQVKDVLRSLT